MASLCRLCGKDFDIGFGLFHDVKPEPLYSLINKYLPIKVAKDPVLPDKICEYCNMNVGTMVDFIKKIIEGQQILRLLLYSKEKSPEINLSEKFSDKVSSEIDECPGDSQMSPNLIEDIVNIQDNPYLKTCMEGKKPKRRRGRPRKLAGNISMNLDIVEMKENTSENEELLRPQRRKTRPLRFRDSEFDRFTENFENSDSSQCESIPLKQEFNYIEREFYNIPKGEKTHRLDDTTVVIGTDELKPLLKQPEALNIELTFEADSHQNQMDNVEDLPPQASIYPVTAPLCNKMDQDSIDRLKKRREKVKKKKFTCELCTKSFVHKGRLATHVRLHKNVILQCIQCKSNFSTKEDITVHQELELHNGIGLLEINENDTADTLLLKENFENVDLSCPQCPDILFSSQLEYNHHVNSCHGEKKWYKCSHCLKLFSYKHNLANHIIMHKLKNKDGRSYPCSMCGRVFEHYSSLVYHREAKHNDNRKYVCTICNANFNHRQLLHRHYIVHSDERPYKCNHCSARFKRYSSLTNHMNTHNNKKIHECYICLKKFNHSTSLVQHMRSHTGEKPYECPQCKKCFSQKSNLIYHIRIHTGEKPYKCSLCERRFISSGKRRIHESRHKRDVKKLSTNANYDENYVYVASSNVINLNPQNTSAQSIELFTNDGPVKNEREILFENSQLRGVRVNVLSALSNDADDRYANSSLKHSSLQSDYRSGNNVDSSAFVVTDICRNNINNFRIVEESSTSSFSPRTLLADNEEESSVPTSPCARIPTGAINLVIPDDNKQYVMEVIRTDD